MLAQELIFKKHDDKNVFLIVNLLFFGSCSETIGILSNKRSRILPCQSFHCVGKHVNNYYSRQSSAETNDQRLQVRITAAIC